MQRLPYHMLWQPRELCRAAAAERPQNLRFYPAGLSHRMRRGDWPHETSITFSQMARTAHWPMAAGAAGALLLRGHPAGAAGGPERAGGIPDGAGRLSAAVRRRMG